MGASMTIGGITPSTLQSAAPASAALLPALEGLLAQAPDVLVLHGAAERIEAHERVQRGQAVWGTEPGQLRARAPYICTRTWRGAARCGHVSTQQRSTGAGAHLYPQNSTFVGCFLLRPSLPSGASHAPTSEYTSLMRFTRSYSDRCPGLRALGHVNVPVRALNLVVKGAGAAAAVSVRSVEVCEGRVDARGEGGLLQRCVRRCDCGWPRLEFA